MRVWISERAGEGRGQALEGYETVFVDVATCNETVFVYLARTRTQALEGYQTVQGLMPTLASAYHQIGLTLSRMNKLEEAYEVRRAGASMCGRAHALGHMR